MRRIINSTLLSLDGVHENPQDFSLQYFDEGAGALAAEMLFGSDALLMGRVTYEGFAEAWPGRDGDFADKFNSIKKYVASTTMDKADWTNSTVIEGDVVEAVRKLKEEPGDDILMYGFGQVARALLDAGLLDEVRFWIHPILFGSGSQSDLLFREGDARKLKLVDTRTFDSGVVVVCYAKADAESEAPAEGTDA